MAGWTVQFINPEAVVGRPARLIRCDFLLGVEELVELHADNPARRTLDDAQIDAMLDDPDQYPVIREIVRSFIVHVLDSEVTESEVREVGG